jgi:DNA polymerase
LAFRLPYWEEGRTGLWHPAFPYLGISEVPRDGDVEELTDWIAANGLVEGHNVWFEFCMWMNQLVPHHGFPSIASSQWRCSAAKASAHSLPRALADALRAMTAHVAARLLGEPVGTVPMGLSKDMEGAAVMRKLAKPRNPRKAEVEWAAKYRIKRKYYWHESKALFLRLFEYCRNDVLAEETLSQMLPDLSPTETDVFLLDREINLRGFRLDMQAVHAALSLIEKEEKLLNGELAVLTKGAVTKATQRVRMIKWFDTMGLTLENTKAETIESELKLTWQPADPCFRGLQLLKQLGRSSTAKYQRMVDHADLNDGRARGGLLYHGAGTGRWSGSGIQPHNFVRGNVSDQEALWEVLKSGERAAIMAFLDADGKALGSVMDALANALRGAIVASEDSELFVADYASIEARVLLWTAGDEEGLDIFRSGRDIYCEMASEIFGRKITKADKKERQIGKAAILGLGYQMGWSKFKDTAEKAGNVLTESFARTVVDVYRQKFVRVKELWSDQEKAAIRAVKAPDRIIHCGKTAWVKEDRFLYCILPSGRRLAYPDPEIRAKQTPWGVEVDGLTYMGINQLTRQWHRQTAYGGMLVENIVQAISRDLMADAMLRIERTGKYRVVLTVHDEIIAECGMQDAGDLKEFEALMAECPPWATDCPVAVEGWHGTRYRK